MTKEKRKSVFKTWYELTEPNKFYWAMQIMLYIARF